MALMWLGARWLGWLGRLRGLAADRSQPPSASAAWGACSAAALPGVCGAQPGPLAPMSLQPEGEEARVPEKLGQRLASAEAPSPASREAFRARETQKFETSQ